MTVSLEIRLAWRDISIHPPTHTHIHSFSPSRMHTCFCAGPEDNLD